MTLYVVGLVFGVLIGYLVRAVTHTRKRDAKGRFVK